MFSQPEMALIDKALTGYINNHRPEGLDDVATLQRMRELQRKVKDQL